MPASPLPPLSLEYVHRVRLAYTRRKTHRGPDGTITLAGQKCLRQYRASVADRPYAQEGAMRVLLHRLDVLARRRGKRIRPLLCVALEFYVRVVVSVV